MRYVKLVVSLLALLISSQASLLSVVSNIPILCKLTNPIVDLTPLDIEDVTSFLKSEVQGALGEFKKALVTQAKNNEKAFSEAKADNEDLDLSIMELIKKYGYEDEEHEVTTDDGYIVTMQRIPGEGQPVLLMHGILGSADDWVTSGNKSLAFLLASEGYDVWLGNSRGNTYSKKHLSLSPDCADFWEFSWHENGKHDLPAMIDYILEESDKPKLAYVGFSQGCTEFLVLGSEFPEHNEKISVAGLLAPVAYTSHMRSPLFRILALTANLDYKILRLLGINSLASNELLTSTVTQLLCGNNAVSKALCSSFLPLLGGYELGQFDVTYLPVILNHFPAGASVKQLQHYVQEINSGRFCQFDYGKKKNEEIYGSETPPDYATENISAPCVVFHGGNDWAANVTDVQRLLDEMPNVVGTEFTPTYGHYAHIWAENANELIFKPLLEYFKKYQ